MMEIEDLDNINLLPLLPLNIKQELLDNGGVASGSGAGGVGVGDGGASGVGGGVVGHHDGATESVGAGSGNGELANLCDSVEKQVDENINSGESTPSKCVWCSQLLTAADLPRLLECLHVACGTCVTNKFSEIDRSLPPLVHCPICSMASQPDNIIENQFLIEQHPADDASATDSDARQTVKCSGCSDDAPATSWCVECSEFICDSCVQAHQRLKITKDHTIKTKEEAAVDNQSSSGADKSLMCHVHALEKLSLFCETCDKLTCRDCQLVDHRDHKYKFAHEIATETRSSLSSLLSEITYKRVLLTSAMKVIDDRQNKIAEKKKELVKEITNMVVKITNTVNMRGKHLVLRLNEVCDSKLNVLNEKKDALQLLSGHTDHCIDFVQTALDKGSDNAVLFSKNTLSRHLQKVKCQRADIPNPEIPVRIQVQLNQVQELQKVISQLGTIIVDGKAFPPTQSPGLPRQQPSPNMIPPMRPNMPPQHSPAIPMPQQMNSGQQPPHYNSPPVYNTPSPQQQQFPMQINRPPFGPDTPANSFVRFPNMGPHNMRQVAPHVSSSTHPQNMGPGAGGGGVGGGASSGAGSQAQQQHMGGGVFGNGPQSFVMQNASTQQQQQQQHQQQLQHQQQQQHLQMQQQQQQQHQQQQHQQQNQQSMRQYPHGNGPPGFGGPPQQVGQPIPGGFMPNGPRYQNFQHRMQQGGGMQQGQVPPNMRPMMPSNELRFAGQQGQIFGQQHPANHPPNHGGMHPQQTHASPPIMHAPAKWHIPQSVQQNNGMAGPSGQSPLMQFGGRQNENSFKISLKSPNTLRTMSQNGAHAGVAANVTSTNPKTPSPSTNDNAKDFTDSIDKACEESVNDLMATIAKLDSNGVQVLPEGRGKTTSPQVHSSTDLTIAPEDKNGTKDDPNEDWCAVCLDGGELMCCDKCPKVFHQNCHIPNISSLPDESETWQCLLCVNLAELQSNDIIGEKRPHGLSATEMKIIQRICLELYCQYEQSLPFREPEPISNIAYYEIVRNPISLDVIRSRLENTCSDYYQDVMAFVSDVRLLFKNVYLFYQEDSKVFAHARYLDQFFEQQLRKWLPQYTLGLTMAGGLEGDAQGDDVAFMTKRSRPATIETEIIS